MVMALQTMVEQQQQQINQLQQLIWLGSTIALACGILWGVLQWRLVILTKNQRHLW